MPDELVKLLGTTKVPPEVTLIVPVLLDEVPGLNEAPKFIMLVLVSAPLIVNVPPVASASVPALEMVAVLMLFALLTLKVVVPETVSKPAKEHDGALRVPDCKVRLDIPVNVGGVYASVEFFMVSDEPVPAVIPPEIAALLVAKSRVILEFAPSVKAPPVILPVAE